MKIAIVGPGIMPIPPKGWGAVEILIWDISKTLESMGHEVLIVNTPNRLRLLLQLKAFKPDFVHIQYDEYVSISSDLNCPCAITSHYGFLEQPHRFGPYQHVMDQFLELQPNIFCLSPGILQTYKHHFDYPEEKLFLVPNGVNSGNFRFSSDPKHPDKSIYLAKIDQRKRQSWFQKINSIYYVGNLADSSFDTSKNYLGEWKKNTLYDSLTEFGNLILLSDCEAHPLVCMEALTSGLGLVISEYATANLDTALPFISVIPEDRIRDIKFVEEEIIRNREISIPVRDEIREYGKSFDWQKIIDQYLLPSIDHLISIN